MIKTETIQTVREYNAQHAGKAWEIAGVMFRNSCLIRCAECAGELPQEEIDLLPIFASDDSGLNCDRCGASL